MFQAGTAGVGLCAKAAAFALATLIGCVPAWAEEADIFRFFEAEAEALRVEITLDFPMPNSTAPRKRTMNEYSRNSSPTW